MLEKRDSLYEYGPDYRLLKAEKRETGEVFEFTRDDQVGSLRVVADSDRDLGIVRFGWRDCLPH